MAKTPDINPEIVRWCALAAAVFFCYLAVQGARTMASAEKTGVAFYRVNRATTERVEKTSSPEKFKNAIFQSEYDIFIAGSAALIAFLVYRRMSAAVYDLSV